MAGWGARVELRQSPRVDVRALGPADARTPGVRIAEGVAVARIGVERDRVRAVATGEGTVGTPRVVEAAGPGAAPAVHPGRFGRGGARAANAG